MVVLAPHPDDEILGCGGMLAFHAERGDRPVVVYLSDGAAGDPSGANSNLAAVRRAESAAALAALGDCGAEHLGIPDGTLDARADLADRILTILNRYHCELLYMPSPLECHSDHVAASSAALRAAASLPAPRVCLFGINQMVPANELYDISRYRNKKDAALAHYKSQLAYKDLMKMSRAMDAVRTINIPDSANITDCEGFLSLSAADLRGGEASLRRFSELLYPGEPGAGGAA